MSASATVHAGWSGDLRVHAFGSGDEARWDAFVCARADATFFHLASWRHVIETVFRHRTHYLLAERDGLVCGVLPLVHLRSRLFGDRLVSTPFCVYGGALAADAAARAALERRACELRDATGADGVELRDRCAATAEGWTARDPLYVTFRRAISGDTERDFQAIPRKQRAMIRKAQGNDLLPVVHADPDRVFRVYAESVRNLGTPVFPRRHFRRLQDAFGDRCQMLSIQHRGRDVAAVLSFRFRDEILPYYGGGTASARALSANDLLYWEVMRRAGADGARCFDFGRSKIGTGAFSFKKNWGFTPEPLNYRLAMRPGVSAPDVNPSNPRYRRFIAGWKRLPLPVANRLGPFIVRGIG